MKKTLVDYVKQNLKKGYNVDVLQVALIQQGYSKAIILNAINRANKELAKELPKLDEKPEIKHEVVDSKNNAIIFKRKPLWKALIGL